MLNLPFMFLQDCILQDCVDVYSEKGLWERDLEISEKVWCSAKPLVRKMSRITLVLTLQSFCSYFPKWTVSIRGKENIEACYVITCDVSSVKLWNMFQWDKLRPCHSVLVLITKTGFLKSFSAGMTNSVISSAPRKVLPKLTLKSWPRFILKALMCFSGIVPYKR